MNRFGINYRFITLEYSKTLILSQAIVYRLSVPLWLNAFDEGSAAAAKHHSIPKRGWNRGHQREKV